MSNYKGISNTTLSRSKITQPFCYWVDVFSPEELQKIDQLMLETPLVEAMVSGDVGHVDNSVRRSKISFHNSNEKNSWIFERINYVIENLNSRFYNYDINGYDGFQYGEYHASEQGKYDWHMDMYIGMMPPTDMETRKLSVVLWLNDNYEGGEFELIHTLLESPVTIPKEKGKLILFPSFLFHRVTPVTKGIRKSIVAWVTGPKFR